MTTLKFSNSHTPKKRRKKKRAKRFTKHKNKKSFLPKRKKQKENIRPKYMRTVNH